MPNVDCSPFMVQSIQLDRKKQVFTFNPYNACVTKKIVNKKEHTVRFHMKDLIYNHVDRKVNDNFLICLNKIYETHGEVKSTCGTVHDYLGMTFDFSEKGKVKVDMIDHMAAMFDDFSTKFKPDDTAPNPAAEDSFAEVTADDLDTQQASEYNTFFAKGVFLTSKLVQILDPQSPRCAQA